MSRGRKPKADAVRRGGLIPSKPIPEVLDAQIVERTAVEMPARVAENDGMRAVWEEFLSQQGHLKPEDAPMMEAWCFWAVVSDQCARDLGDDPSPDLIRKAEKASTMLMRLGDQLHLTPTARQRAGLIQAMTISTQDGVVERARRGFAASRGQDA